MDLAIVILAVETGAAEGNALVGVFRFAVLFVFVALMFGVVGVLVALVSGGTVGVVAAGGNADRTPGGLHWLFFQN